MSNINYAKFSDIISLSHQQLLIQVTSKEVTIMWSVPLNTNLWLSAATHEFLHPVFRIVLWTLALFQNRLQGLKRFILLANRHPLLEVSFLPLILVWMEREVYSWHDSPHVQIFPLSQERLLSLCLEMRIVSKFRQAIM